ncbi:MAG: NADP-dependent oxidoreductase [Chitinophagaceae bacterium]
MKIIALQAPGGVDQLIYQELALPVPNNEEVLIEVRAISINPVDIKTRMGKGFYSRLKDEHPMIIGWDISGVVSETRSPLFKKGDAVFGMVNFPGHGRAYAEYVAAPAAHLALKPADISFEEAAAATLAALTAWQVLVDHAGIKAGNRVLIHAAAGGVGHYAVQIAKALGAHVTGIASAANRDFVLGLGADEYFDYATGPFESGVHDIDMAFDAVGGDTGLRTLPVLKKGGLLIGIAGGIDDNVKEKAKELGVTAISTLVQSSGADMNKIAELLKNKKMHSTVSSVFPFSAMADAHKQIETGRTRGKIIVTMD